MKRWSVSDLRPRIWPQVLRLVTNGDVGQAPSPADALVQGLSPSQLCWNSMPIRLARDATLRRSLTSD